MMMMKTTVMTMTTATMRVMTTTMMMMMVVVIVDGDGRGDGCDWWWSWWWWWWWWRRLPITMVVKTMFCFIAEPDADSEQELNRNNMRTAQGRSRRAVRIGIMAPVGHCGQKGQKGEPGPQGIPGVKGEPGESIQVPTVAVSPKSLTVNESEVASMQCSASGNPVPTVVWSKVNGSLPAVRSEVFAGGKLEIRSSEGNDSGVYQCEASNILGTSRGQVKLNVNSE